MFNDDFWGYLFVGAFGLTAYASGKERGKQQMIAHYDAQAVIKNQQDQIDQLNARLNQITGGK